MNAKQLLDHVCSLGITLCAGASGKLRFEAPAGRLTRDLREALLANKPEILDLLEAKTFAARRIVYCRDCGHYIPSAPVRRASGALWDMPGGCTQGRTSPDRRPPIYPFTGRYCEGWTPRTPK